MSQTPDLLLSSAHRLRGRVKRLPLSEHFVHDHFLLSEIPAMAGHENVHALCS